MTAVRVGPHTLETRTVPLDWPEVSSGDFDPRRYRLSNVFRRLGHKHDPWDGISRNAVSVARLALALHATG